MTAAASSPALEDTNDIGFQAVEVKDGFGVEPGVWFRLMLGGITGHKDFARETGVVVRPADATKVADAVVRVFIDHGDRTNRNKARLKYVIDRLGMDKVVALTEEKLGRKLDRVPPEALAPRPPFDRAAHIGVHAQKQDGLNFIGVVLPVGRLTPDQMRGLAGIARALGDGDIRLTVWQNLLISGVPDDKVKGAVSGIKALGLSVSASSIRAGLVACTGNVGCRFAASDTKRHAEEIARWCEARVELDGPVNIHLTGCHHSCAQHYIGDIGLLACKVSINDDGDTVEGYHVLVGGGAGPDAGLAREIFMDVRAEEAPTTVERLLQAMWRIAARPTRPSWRSRAGMTSRRSRRCARRWRHERSTPPADPAAHSGERAVHRRAAHLAQRLLRRPRLARRRGHAAVVGRIRGADADAARRATPRTTTTRPGTTRRSQ